MKRQSFANSALKTVLPTLALVLLVCVSTSSGQVDPDLHQEGFIEDPTLSAAQAPPTASESSPLTIKSNGEQTNLSVGTDALISPYLGASKEPPEIPDDMPIHYNSRKSNPLDNYHLETGVGLKVNKQTNVNLGYRFNNSTHLLDNESRDNTSQESGDIRFSLEFELPF